VQMNADYRSDLASMYRDWARLPFVALVSYVSELRRLHFAAWPPMSSERDRMWREYAVRMVLRQQG
jgi:hypothetical protein